MSLKKIALFSVRFFERPFLEQSFNTVAGAQNFEFVMFEFRLTEQTVSLVKKDFKAVMPFTNDQVNEAVLKRLKEYGVEMISCRSAGFDNVDL